MDNQSTELTIPATTANVYGLIAGIFLTPILLAPFYFTWGLNIHETRNYYHTYGLQFFLILLVGTIIHELIHGATAAWYVGIGWNNVRFGMQWISLTPFCHSKVPMTAKNYRYVVMSPLIILGLLPYLVSLLTGSGWILTVGIIFTIAAAGDVIILWLMRKLAPNEMVQDHPTKVGLLLHA